MCCCTFLRTAGCILLNSKARPPCIIPSLGIGGAKGEDQVVLMKASTAQQPRFRLAWHQGCNFTWCNWVTPRESLNYFFMEWGNSLILEQTISIIYKNNSDIGPPWIETCCRRPHHPVTLGSLSPFIHKKETPVCLSPPGLCTHTHAQSFIINTVCGRSCPCQPNVPLSPHTFCIRLASALAKYPETVLSRTAVPLRFVQRHDKFMKMQRM